MFLRFLALLTLLVALAAHAQVPASGSNDVVLAENGKVKLMLSDYQTEILNLPAEMRGAFASDPKRVAALLNNLLLMKTLAEDARKEGVDRDPVSQRRMAQEANKVLAQIEIGRVEARAAADFDKRIDEFTARAREMYAVDKDKHRRPAQVRASHILFASTRGDEAALAAARDARAKLLAGADFAALARELSDDEGSKRSGGKLDWFAEGEYDPAFTKAAFALAKEGDISEPVKSRFGWHLIKLEGRRQSSQISFDEAKPQMLADLRVKYINDQRDALINAIRNDPANKANQPAIDALVQAPPPAR